MTTSASVSPPVSPPVSPSMPKKLSGSGLAASVSYRRPLVSRKNVRVLTDVRITIGGVLHVAMSRTGLAGQFSEQQAVRDFLNTWNDQKRWIKGPAFDVAVVAGLI